MTALPPDDKATTNSDAQPEVEVKVSPWDGVKTNTLYELSENRFLVIKLKGDACDFEFYERGAEGKIIQQENKHTHELNSITVNEAFPKRTDVPETDDNRFSKLEILSLITALGDNKLVPASVESAKTVFPSLSSAKNDLPDYIKEHYQKVLGGYPQESNTTKNTPSLPEGIADLPKDHREYLESPSDSEGKPYAPIEGGYDPIDNAKGDKPVLMAFISKTDPSKLIAGYKTKDRTQYYELDTKEGNFHWVPAIEKNLKETLERFKPCYITDSKFLNAFAGSLKEQSLKDGRFDKATSWFDVLFHDSFMSDGPFLELKDKLREHFQSNLQPEGSKAKDFDIKDIATARTAGQKEFKIHADAERKKKPDEKASFRENPSDTIKVDYNGKVDIRFGWSGSGNDSSSDDDKEKKISFSNPKVWWGASIFTGMATLFTAIFSGGKRKTNPVTGKEEPSPLAPIIAVGAVATVAALAVGMWTQSQQRS
jgi:hypothetical protein